MYYVIFLALSDSKVQEFVYTPSTDTDTVAMLVNPVFCIWPQVLIHITSSWAIHLGNNILACLVLPWQSFADMSMHPAFIVPRSTFDHVDGGHKPFTSMRKSDTILGWAAYHSVTAREWGNATLSHTITNIGRFRLTATLSSPGTTLP